LELSGFVVLICRNSALFLVASPLAISVLGIPTIPVFHVADRTIFELPIPTIVAVRLLADTPVRPYFTDGWSRMATFYILPPRSCLEQALGELFGKLLPGLPLPADSWEIVTDRLGSAAEWPADVFLVPRDDLPDDEPLGCSLTAAFGAEAGDRVVEVNLGKGPTAMRTWVVGNNSPSMSSAATGSPVLDQAGVSGILTAR
jgi:hypothetical protein